MKNIDSASLQRHFGQFLHEASKEDLMVTKYNKNFVAMISAERYNQLIQMEEDILLKATKKAHKNGYLSKQKSKQLLESLLNS